MSFEYNKYKKEEYELIETAERIGGSHSFCLKCLHLLYNILDVSEPLDKPSHIFFIYYSSLRKNLTLTFFSILRKHFVQSSLTCRHATESLGYALYSLYTQRIEDFIIEKDGMEIQNPQLKTLYKNWIEENFKDISDRIKKLKDLINERHAHSNINNALQNLSISSEVITTDYFDIATDEDIEENLIAFSNVIMTFIEYIIEVNEKEKTIRLLTSLKSDVANLRDEFFRSVITS